MTLETIAALFAAAGLGLGGWAAGRRLGRQNQVSPLLFSMVVVLALVAAWALSGRLLWAVILPSAEAIFWANWMPAILCFTAGLATSTPGLHRWHRPATVGLLWILAACFWVGPFARPWIAPATVLDDDWIGWRRGVCLQSHPSTCGPASAATLLSEHDIRSSEKDLMATCFTSRWGTEPLGLYRGLTLASAHAGLKPQPASPDSRQWVHRGQVPNVAIVRLGVEDSDGSLSRWFGAAQERHAITVLGRTDDGLWLIGDPAIGLVSWTDAQMQKRFTGEAICLVPDHSVRSRHRAVAGKRFEAMVSDFTSEQSR
ncbi:cysteine peptidase family C39 domain-containing protein [Crateriforma conspicua]|uniref:cysteine peptidase family C39 domain-containing protein n=1 Tax=Crateriforma conspicua TaxID=2527996 RepID=UPI001187C7A9|nr:cysteine peptidase family C39 domain-containing protein [Crateriforma conspicua]QDV66112.1 Peptidase C39 family protein [Crateriforma conspicua]